jgi:hypothetical protein
MLRPRRPAWNGVESAVKDATNDVMRVAKDATSGAKRDEEAAKRQPALGLPVPEPLAQSNSNLVGQNSTWPRGGHRHLSFGRACSPYECRLAMDG